MTFEELYELVKTTEAPNLLDAVDRTDSIQSAIAINLTPAYNESRGKIYIQYSNTSNRVIAINETLGMVLREVDKLLNLSTVTAIRYAVKTKQIVITTDDNRIYHNPEFPKFKLINYKSGGTRSLPNTHIELELKLIKALLLPIAQKIDYVTRHAVVKQEPSMFESIMSKNRSTTGMPRGSNHYFYGDRDGNPMIGMEELRNIYREPDTERDIQTVRDVSAAMLASMQVPERRLSAHGRNEALQESIRNSRSPANEIALLDSMSMVADESFEAYRPPVAYVDNICAEFLRTETTDAPHSARRSVFRLPPGINSNNENSN